MKKIIIIISAALLVSSIALAARNRTKVTPYDILKLDVMDLPDGSVYKGEVKDGKPHGNGVRYAKEFTYRGDFKNGKADGKGVLSEKKLKTRYVLIGDFKEGLPHGSIIKTSSTGDRFEGEYIAGKRKKGKEYLWNGLIYEGTFDDKGYRKQGKLTYPRGETWEGPFRGAEGSPWGMGTYTDLEGNKWTGEFRAGQPWSTSGTLVKPDGEVIENHRLAVTLPTPRERYVYRTLAGSELEKERAGTKMTDGSYYEGETLNRKPEGRGVYTWPDDALYIGEFRGGQSNGHGVLITPDSGKFEGNFKDGVPHGKGEYINKDGARSVGEFVDGVLQGEGETFFPDGTRYKGNFRNGKPYGEGTWYNSDGTVKEQ